MTFVHRSTMGSTVSAFSGGNIGTTRAPNRPFYRNYLPSVLRLKDANIGSVVFKKAKVFNSIKVSHRVPADTAITAP